MKILLTSTILILINIAQGHADSGDCPSKVAVSNFSLKDFAGTWQEEKRFDHHDSSRGCVRAIFTDNQNGTVTVQEYYKTLPSTKSYNDTEIAVLEDPNYAHFTLQGNHSAEFLVLSTDYTSYAVFWSCEPVVNGSKALREYIQ